MCCTCFGFEKYQRPDFGVTDWANAYLSVAAQERCQVTQELFAHSSP